MNSSTLLFSGVASAFVLTSSLSAQSWVDFLDHTSTRLSAPSNVGSADPEEKDFAWDDFDQDGDIDLVCVRKQPFTSTGHRSNVLYMNENGVLTDRTSTLATHSTVAGSNGFLDLTNDRDVVVVDVNNDGLLDLVTATTLSTGSAQISNPRVYINRGFSGSTWLGFTFDDHLRIDSWAAWNGDHRFCSVSAGDIDDDGDADLYFGDYQQGGNRAIDVNDRLYINDGTGYFTDESSLRMTVTMLESSFAMSTAIVDMNDDGKLDILKDDALNAPQGISISYNDNATGTGFYGTYSIAYGFAPYHFAVGDLNNDGLPDLVVSDDGPDRYMLHAGVAGGLATFNAAQVFSYTGGGSDDGFGGNNLIEDLNNDGWNDVIITDVDVDISGYNRRCHIYRNLCNGPNVTLREDTVGGAVVGIPIAELRGTHDVAVFDIDGDGWKDMVIGRSVGTRVWMNNPPIGLVMAYPGGLISQQAPGEVKTLYVDVTGIGGLSPAAGTGELHCSINNGPWTSIAMRDEGPGQYSVKLPRLIACADELRYYISVEDTNSATFTDPPTAPSAVHESVGATGTAVTFEDNFEGGATGWTVQSTNLTSGAWQLAIPNGTTTGGQFAAPNDDAEAGAASHCYVTQNGAPGGAAGSADVDGGPTDLISPVFDMDGTDGFVSYARWFFSSGTDTMIVSITNNGSTWTTVETVTSTGNNQWNVITFRVSDYVVPSATMQVRFRTADQPNNSITEAGVDVFRVSAYLCECAPICQLNLGLQGPGTASFSGSMDDPPGGPPTASLLVEGAPVGTPGWIIASFDFDPAPAFGGTLVDLEPFLILPFVADATGTYGVHGITGGFGPLTLYGQGVYLLSTAPQGVGITNGLQIDFP